MLRSALLVACLLLAAPPVRADVALEAPAATLVVDNQHDGCQAADQDRCFYGSTGEDPGRWELDSYQRIHYAGVATDFDLVRSHLGEAWLLEDRSVVFRGEDLHVPNPVFPLATETWQQHEPATPEGYRLVLSPEGIWLESYNPAPVDPAGPWGHREYGTHYGDRDVQYDQVGPVNAPQGSDTDNHVHGTIRLTCLPDRTAACYDRAEATFDDYQDHAPNLTYGLEFYDFELATDPSNLSLAAEGQVAERASALRVLQPVEEGAETEGPSESVEGDDPGSPDEGDRPTRSTPPSPFQARSSFVKAQSQLPQPPPPDRSVELLVGIAAATGALLAALGFGLYSRFNNKSDALQSGTRERILALIREIPGIGISEVAERMGMARNAVLHHLRVLERVQLVKVAQEGGLKVLYPVGVKQAPLPVWLRRSPACLAIVQAAQAAEGFAREDVARLLPDVPERTRNHHLQRLVSSGILLQESAPDGRKVLRPASGGSPGPA